MNLSTFLENAQMSADRLTSARDRARMKARKALAKGDKKGEKVRERHAEVLGKEY